MIQKLCKFKMTTVSQWWVAFSLRLVNGVSQRSGVLPPPSNPLNRQSRKHSSIYKSVDRCTNEVGNAAPGREG